MELVHDFTVPVPADQAWTVLTDIEQIVPCMPGATISAVSGDSFEGAMKIKLGPIAMTFKGDGSFTEKDAAAKRAVINAKGRDARGNGGAQALVTATLTESEGSTAVHVVTDLNVSGKAAQFGTGVMKDVSNRLLQQFVTNFAALLTDDATAAKRYVDATTTSRPTVSTTPSNPSDEGLNLTSLLFGSDSVRHSARTVGVAAIALAFGYLWGKNRTLERHINHG